MSLETQQEKAPLCWNMSAAGLCYKLRQKVLRWSPLAFLG
jgi:hypothetical protein